MWALLVLGMGLTFVSGYFAALAKKEKKDGNTQD